MPLAPNAQLGRYEIRQRLGAGGMGEVYLAHDMKLGRTVALKILPAEVAADQKRMQRFIQEAQAASALNHPNIITIHEIEEADSTHFIATEFIDGETLRGRMSRARLTIAESLDIAIQVASALSTAHEAGIVHRDIKPDNIMLRRDSIVKVLDFGLAKLTETQASSVDTEAPTRAIVNTEPGTVMGTAHYMSPEQARGLDVDERTDIWSLGVVLYEMVAAHQPFVGETTTDVLASIVKTQPAPLTRFAPEAPAKLEEIVGKALEKDREERYQGVKDLLVDLRRLKKRLEFEAEMDRSVSPESISAPTIITDSAQFATETKTQVVAPAETEQTTRTTSSAEYLVSSIKRHKLGAILTIVASVLILGAAGYGIYRYFNRTEKRTAEELTFQSMKVSRLTSSSRVISAEISPDGRYLAYINEEAGQRSIRLKQIKTGTDVQIVAPGQALGDPLNFSPDGDYVYYRVRDLVKDLYILYVIPSLGGTPHKAIYDIDSAPTFSPDGKQMAFVRNNSPVEGMSYLMLANADGTGEKILATRKGSEGFNIPAWSPDGKTIVCAEGYSSVIGNIPLIAVSPADGSIKNLGESRWGRVGRIAWLPDGGGLLMTARDATSAAAQIWHINYPAGEVRRVTNDLINYIGMSLTRDGAAMVVVQAVTETNVWLAPEGKSDAAHQITQNANTSNGFVGLSVLPDYRAVYYSSSNGDDIWIANTDGTNVRQLTSNAGRNLWPDATRDGRYIVFSSNRNGHYNLFRMDADGGNQVQLTHGAGEFNPSCSPDSRWVVYQSFDEDGKDRLYKISIDGGEPQVLADVYADYPAVSPDGKQVACLYYEDAYHPPHIGVIPFEGGPVTFIRDMPASGLRLSQIPLHWTPDGKAIAFIDAEANGTYNLRAAPIAGGDLKTLTDFKSGMIFWFAWSPDGKQLALTRGQRAGDAVMFSNLK